MKPKLPVAILGMLIGTSLLAAPAPWYKWQSRLDGKEFCAQTAPGEGWKQVDGPYQDAGCKKPGLPGR